MTDPRWAAPASGTPLEPHQVAAPSAEEIAARVASKLIVPRGPLRTVSTLLGLVGGAFPATAYFNSKQNFVLLGGPGIIRSVEILSSFVVTGAAAGYLQLFDYDTNSPLLRSYPISIGAAGTAIQTYTSNGINLPFLEGIYGTWTPITAAFGANSVIGLNIDYDSIPIGQRLDQS